jgi:hypothetical protein
MRAPVTRVDWPTDGTPAPFTIAGNAPKPTLTSDANVYPIPLVLQDEADISEGKFSNLQEVEEFWQMMFNTDSATSDCLVTIWAYNIWTDDWHPWAKLEVKGDDLLAPTHGRIWTDNGILGSSHIGVQVENHAGQELHVTHMWS